MEALDRCWAGVINADYRGDAEFEVKVGDRIAQQIIEVIMMPDVAEVDDLDSTARGSSGFASTGI